MKVKYCLTHWCQMQKVLIISFVLTLFLGQYEEALSQTEQDVCYASDVELNVTLSNSQWRIVWLERLVTDSNWDTLTSLTDMTTYHKDNVIESLEVKSLVDTNLDGQFDSTILNITLNVLPEFLGAKLIGSDTAICYNTLPLGFDIITDCSGGKGVYTYSWQRSDDGVAFYDVSNDRDYEENTLLQQDKWYRLLSSDYCGVDTSNVVAILVYDSITTPVISRHGDSTICYGFVAGNLYVSDSSAGGDGVFSYRWQVKRGGEFYDIGDGKEYYPGNLYSDSVYRVVSYSGYCDESRVSNEKVILVYDEIGIGSIDIPDYLCYGMSGEVGVHAIGGGDEYSYKWLRDDNSEVVGSYDSIMQTGDLMISSVYRVKVISNKGCDSVISGDINVLVYDSITTPVISRHGDSTICYGFVAGNLYVSDSSAGGDGVFSYRWQVKRGGEFYDIGDGKEYYPGNLYSDSVYRVVSYSGYCDESRVSNEKVILVYDSITAPVISRQGDSTICYGFVPGNLYVSDSSVGGDGVFSYRWQVKRGGEFYDIGDGKEYYPGNLYSDSVYRVVSYSGYCDESRVSNEKVILVYDEIGIGSIDIPDYLCYGMSGEVGVHAIGGGDEYSYKWLRDDNSEVVGSYDSIMQTGDLMISSVYRVKVISNKGCDSVISGDININVLSEFRKGLVSTDLDSACFAVKPNYMITSTNCSGGSGHYLYQWLYGDDSVTYNETDTTNYLVAFEPDTIWNTMYYKLKYTDSICLNTLESDVHIIKMNPLPPYHSIEGPRDVCYEQYATYTLPEYSSKYSYEWTTLYNSGDVTLLSDVNDSVEIYWKEPNYEDSIKLEIRDNVTGCINHSTQAVTSGNLIAPERTTVIRKPNSNILICKEDSISLYYVWGYTEKANGKDTILEEGADKRYILLPHTFDSVKYSYWVELYPKENSPCYSKSYYDSKNDEQIITPTKAKVFIPTLTYKKIPITIVNDKQADIQCWVYNVNGVELYHKSLGNADILEHNIDINYKGVCIVRVIVGKEVFSNKTIVE